MARYPVRQPDAALTSPPNTPPSYNGTPLPDQESATNTHAQIPYSPAFTDALMKHILSASAANPSTSRRGGKSTKEDGIKVLPLTSAEAPSRGSSLRLQDLDPSTLPDISPAELPLPLDDPRRVFASGVPGIRLTHPGGWLEGGAGPSPGALEQLAAAAAAATAAAAEDTPTDAGTPLPQQQQPPPPPPDFARDFVEQHNITTPASLRTHINAAIVAQIDELKRSMREREDAIRKNERLEREIADLVAEREMERRVHERQMKMRREKMEERERDKAQSGG